MNLLPDDCPGHARVQSLADLSPTPRAATIGNYDGLHRGHQAVLRKLTDAAKERGLESILLSFEPSPQEFFLGDRAPPRICALADKAVLINTLCPELDRVAVLPFGQTLSTMSARGFLQDTLSSQLNVRYLTVGKDFRFGRGREGDTGLLISEATTYGFEFEPTATVNCSDNTQGDVRVSSTRIREALSAGDIKRATDLLGHPYAICAKVIRGDARGRELGFPTANLDFPHNPPVRGVFAVRAHCAGEEYPAVANVGNRPTLDGTQLVVEVHLLDFAGDLYGKRLTVQFCQHLRTEKKFESIQHLREQIVDDIATARKYFTDAV